MSNKILFLDTETTGVDTEVDHICEVGFELVEYSEGKPVILESTEFFAKPPVPIPFEAMGIHHITNERVAGEPPIESFVDTIQHFVDQADFLCAHNMKFDYEMLSRIFPDIIGPTKDNLIDTLRLLKHIEPGLPSYSLNALRYRYSLAEGLTGEAHRALFDAGMCRNLLQHCLSLKPMDFEDMPAFIAAPMMLKTVSFGKHRGDEISEMMAKDSSYVYWLFKQSWFEVENPDLAYTIKQLGFFKNRRRTKKKLEDPGFL